VPLAPAKEEAIVDIVAFFTRKGKAVRILKEKRFILKVKREGRGLQKLKRYERFREVHDFTNTFIT